MMRIAVSIFFSLILGFMLLQGYRLYHDRSALMQEMAKATTTVAALEDEHVKLEGDIRYLSDSHNLMKELKVLFNFRAPHEELIVIIPQASSTR
jgi:cell division protein FtsB